MRFTILSLILYGPAFAVLAEPAGRAAGALVLIPVVLGGWGGGIAGGVFAATVGCILTTLGMRFVLNVPGNWLEVAFGRGGAVGVIVTYALGIVVGHVRDSILRLRDELNVRRRAETRLRATEARLRASESRLRESESGYRMLFEQNPLPMWVFDPKALTILAVNQAAVDAYGHDVDKFLSLTTLDLVLTDHVDEARAWFQNDARTDHRETGRWRHRARNGAIINVEVTTRAILFAGRRAALASVADVTKVREVEGRLEHRANHDPLTALPNRAFYQRRVEAAIAASASIPGSSALLLIDLDRFKAVNDNYGHSYGDEVLKTVAQRLREGLRSGDVAARLGGDEFALL
ncbi:MAG: sensor domain-containing diguanylate cyclase, partial [Isosphaeraceae bacterium]